MNAPTSGESLLPPLPTDEEAERGLIGCVLLDSSILTTAAAGIEFGHFHVDGYDLIWRAILALADAGKPIDATAVSEHLTVSGIDADRYGGWQHLQYLANCAATTAGAARYAAAVRKMARHRHLIQGLEAAVTLAHEPDGEAKAAEQAEKTIARVRAASAPPPELFKTVDLSRLGQATPSEQEWFWQGLVPAGHLSYLGGHGGAGKSTLGLLVAVCMAVGHPCLGKATKRSRVLFFSGEDPEDLVLRRIERICRVLEIDPQDVREQLHVIDATEFDPVLFFERRLDGIRAGTTTPTYAALAKYVDGYAIEFVVVDNASDTFDGDEINRTLVRGFIRALTRLVRPRNGAVLLLAHVDKGTSRAGKAQTNTEAYSGSTAWHNSARSRLFLLEKDTGVFELQHQKCNLGPKQEPLVLDWPKDGVLQVAQTETAGGFVQPFVDAADMRALLALVHEFYGRGEYIATAQQSRNHAVALLSGEKTYPKRKGAEVFTLLREAERKHLIFREAYKDVHRKRHECWALTPEGCAFIGVAPCAPCAPGSHDGA